MAFCPECGKAVTPENAVCTSCGTPLPADERRGRTGRFHGTMMITAPEVKPEPAANSNAQEQADLAAAAGMTSPRLSMPATAKHSSSPASAKHTSNPAPRGPGPSLGRPGSATGKATMVGAGVVPSVAAKKQFSKAPARKHATMLGGASLVPTTPRSKPPAAATKPPSVEARASIPAPAEPVVPIPQSDRPMVARPTTPQGSNNASVRAVQNVPISPLPARPMSARVLGTKPGAGPAPGPAVTDAQTVESPVLRLDDRRDPDPARMVQAIPEVTGTVVEATAARNDARTVPRTYLPGDPMAPQPPAAARAPRTNVFAPEQPEEDDQGNYILLYWAVCVAVVAAVSALAFRLF
jgi:hypothetical protein